MKDHIATISGLIAVLMILLAAVTMTFHGIKEDALLIILLTGAVEIGKAIVGIKPPQPNTQQPPATPLAAESQSLSADHPPAA